uniref:hypothetical protein n=1 Tax=Flavobacterium sp. TaxID=239 RepID=UPI0037BFF648
KKLSKDNRIEKLSPTASRPEVSGSGVLQFTSSVRYARVWESMSLPFLVESLFQKKQAFLFLSGTLCSGFNLESCF